MAKIKYTDEELIKVLKDAFQELGRVPNALDFEKRKPNYATFSLRFGSWDEALAKAGMKKDRQKLKDYTSEELIGYLQRYYFEYGKVPTTRDLKRNKNYPSDETFRNHFGNHKNALIAAGLYELRTDKILFERKEYTRDDVIKLVNDFIIKNNRVPTYDDLKYNKELPTGNVIIKHFDNLNTLIELLGYEPVNKSLVIKSKEEMIDDIYRLYLEIGRTPTSRDINKCNYTASDGAYISRFESLYNVFEISNIPYNKRTRFLTDQEVIDIWYNLKNKLNRVPTLVEIVESEINISDSIYWRWGGYSEFLKELDEDLNYNLYGCRVYQTSNGTKCFSLLELKLTQWLEDNNIKFKKDYPYKIILENDNTDRTLDWLILHNDNAYYVELFGIQNNEFYDSKTKKKIEDFKKNNLPLIELYPNIIRGKEISDIFSFLLIK